MATTKKEAPKEEVGTAAEIRDRLSAERKALAAKAAKDLRITEAQNS